jgi:hypothetical protein
VLVRIKGATTNGHLVVRWDVQGADLGSQATVPTAETHVAEQHEEL